MGKLQYHKSLLESFILLLATNDFSSTLRHFTTILSTLPFPVVIMRQEGNFQQAAWLFAIYITERVAVGFRVWLEA